MGLAMARISPRDYEYANENQTRQLRRGDSKVYSAPNVVPRSKTDIRSCFSVHDDCAEDVPNSSSDLCRKVQNLGFKRFGDPWSDVKEGV